MSTHLFYPFNGEDKVLLPAYFPYMKIVPLLVYVQFYKKKPVQTPCKNRVCTGQERMEDSSGSLLKQVLDSSERSSGLSHPFSLQTHMFQFILLLFPFCECNVQITQLSFWLLNEFL